MAYQIDYAYTCHTGKVRTNNEDNFWCCGVRLPVHNQGVDGILAGHTQHWKLPMLAVFDGMGGESCGEMAASAAVEALGGFYEENKKTLKKEPVVFLTGACENMNEAVCRYSNENCIRSMGTTMALLSFSEKAIYACNLGDSRIYRHFQGKFQQISTDHVIGGKMLGKAPLTQYLGFQEENMALEPSIVEIGYQPGSSYLICSDGVTDMLSDQELQKILDGTETAEEKVGKILEQALERGGRDNVTLILAQISGYEEKNLLNDLRFSEIWLRNHIITKPQGRIRLLRELISRGIKTGDAKKAIDDFFKVNDEIQLCRRAYKKALKSGKKDEKLIKYLMDSGFSYKLILSVADEEYHIL